MTEDSPTPPPPPPPVGTPPPYPAYGPPQPARRPAWFWIAIIGGCFVLLIPVLLIVAALAIPQMLKARKTADETSAIRARPSSGDQLQRVLPRQRIRMLARNPRWRSQFRSPHGTGRPVDRPGASSQRPESRIHLHRHLRRQDDRQQPRHLHLVRDHRRTPDSRQDRRQRLLLRRERRHQFRPRRRHQLHPADRFQDQASPPP